MRCWPGLYFVVITLVLSTNRVDFGLFLFHKFSNFTPPQSDISIESSFAGFATPRANKLHPVVSKLKTIFKVFDDVGPGGLWENIGWEVRFNAALTFQILEKHPTVFKMENVEHTWVEGSLAYFIYLWQSTQYWPIGMLLRSEFLRPFPSRQPQPRTAYSTCTMLQGLENGGV